MHGSLRGNKSISNHKTFLLLQLLFFFCSRFFIAYLVGFASLDFGRWRPAAAAGGWPATHKSSVGSEMQVREPGNVHARVCCEVLTWAHRGIIWGLLMEDLREEALSIDYGRRW